MGGLVYGMKHGRPYVPDKWQTLEIQEGKDESEELPDASLISEAHLAAQR